MSLLCGSRIHLFSSLHRDYFTRNSWSCQIWSINKQKPSKETLHEVERYKLKHHFTSPVMQDFFYVPLPTENWCVLCDQLGNLGVNKPGTHWGHTETQRWSHHLSSVNVIHVEPQWTSSVEHTRVRSHQKMFIYANNKCLLLHGK